MKIRVLLKNDNFKALSIEKYLENVLPREMPETWHLEALKAQAIASRTYAMYAAKHPRHFAQLANLCATQHCQVYDAKKPASTKVQAAIQSTNGEVITQAGMIINAFYSSACGGKTQLAETVWSYKLPYIKESDCPCARPKHGHGVGMCQNGAHALAKDNYSYQEILRHYYDDISIARVSNQNILSLNYLLRKCWLR